MLLPCRGSPCPHPHSCPPGGAIAYPRLHTLAGGVGTFADPITFAGAPAATPPGTVIYIPSLRKYGIMEDYCQECDADWAASRQLHVDIWMGPSAVTAGPNLIACENAITADSVTVVINAPAGLAVDTTPLFDGATLTCIVPATPCVDASECVCVGGGGGGT